MEPISDSLDTFPGVHLAVDIAVFTVTRIEGEFPRLQLLIHQRPTGYLAGTWMLPGRFLRPGETVTSAGAICLKEKVGISGVKLRNLVILDEPDRDPRGWTASIGSVTTLPYETARTVVVEKPQERMWIDVGARHLYLPGEQSALPFGQTKLVNAAINYLRDRYFTSPDPRGFLGETFTLRELYEVHVAIWGEEVVSIDTFRRTMDPLLIDTGEMRSGKVGKPSVLYRKRGRQSSSPSVRRLERPKPSELPEN